MIATEYRLRLTRVTIEYSDEGYEVFGSRGAEQSVSVWIVVPKNNTDYPLKRIVKELGERIVKEMESEA